MVVGMIMIALIGWAVENLAFGHWRGCRTT
jgi:hypothetical protein